MQTGSCAQHIFSADRSWSCLHTSCNQAMRGAPEDAGDAVSLSFLYLSLFSKGQRRNRSTDDDELQHMLLLAFRFKAFLCACSP
jgi:hypothetical protein